MKLLVLALAAITLFSGVPRANAATTRQASLYSVSCASTSMCVAVGDRYDGLNNYPVALRWNGRKWLQEELPNAPGVYSARLRDISCPTTTFCTAVGHTDMDPNRPLVYTWDGSGWTANYILTRGHAYLNGVSCTSPAACVAVGFFIDTPNFYAYAERWNGRTWSEIPPLSLVAAAHNSLGEVSCVKARLCYATGYQDGVSPNVLLERWDGAAWRLEALPKDAPYGAGITGIDCISGRRCFAVGQDLSGEDDRAFTAHRDGPEWIDDSPASLKASLVDVSCLSASMCTAVGQTLTRTGKGLTASARWDGSNWVGHKIANPTTSFNQLLGVDCVTPAFCMAVGSASNGLDDAVLVEKWNGTRWVIQSVPDPRP